MAIEIKITERNGETFTFKNVKTYTTQWAGGLLFVDEHDADHYTNAEFHVTDTGNKPKKP